LFCEDIGPAPSCLGSAPRRPLLHVRCVPTGCCRGYRCSRRRNRPPLGHPLSSRRLWPGIVSSAHKRPLGALITPQNKNAPVLSLEDEGYHLPSWCHHHSPQPHRYTGTSTGPRAKRTPPRVNGRIPKLATALPWENDSPVGSGVSHGR